MRYRKIREQLFKTINTGTALAVEGTLTESQGSGQNMELNAEKIEILGHADPEKYPIQPKKHTLEFLRENAHLRFRTNTFGAIFRIRHALAFAIHKYFNEKGFCYLHTPIITASDAEGAGQMFRVTVLDPVNPPLQDNGHTDFRKTFLAGLQILLYRDNSKESLALLHLVKYTHSGQHSGQKIQIQHDIWPSSG